MCHIYITHYEQPEKMKHTAEHKVGLKLLSTALQELYDIQISPDDLEDHIEKNEYGKPYLKNHPEIHFNISHCNDVAVCAVSNQTIGADIEEIKEFNPLIFRKVLTDEEKEFLEKMSVDEVSSQEWFFRFWTLKEARIKHAGMGLSMSLTSFSFQFSLNEEPYRISCSDKDTHFRQQILEDKYILAVCTSNPEMQLEIKYV